MRADFKGIWRRSCTWSYNKWSCSCSSKDGENPVKADGKLYVIDGGLSKAYQAKTGIAGYTLIFNSHYLALAQHHDYISHPLSKPESDDMPTLQITQKMDKRILVSDTDAGKKLSKN